MQTTSTLKEVRLYGHLGKRFGQVHHFAVASPAEAIRALCSNFKGFREHLYMHSVPGYKIIVGTEARTLETLSLISVCTEVIKIIPVISGAKNGMGQIIFGAALLAASLYAPYMSTALWGTATVGSMVGSIGISMMLAGVSNILAPLPKALGPAERPDNKPSYGFDGPVNTAAQGNPVPIAYGELLVGSQVISAGLSTEQIAPF